MKKWPFLIAFLLLIMAIGLIQSFSKNERYVSNKPFAQFPLDLAAQWNGRELGLDEKVLNVLRLSDYMMRVYVPSCGTRRRRGRMGLRIMVEQILQMTNVSSQALPIWLYVGFYQSQRTGATYHSPKNCLPGAGLAGLWNLNSSL